ncbi:MAG: hypothetical protein JXA18_10660 [Chitinispirillaceae bacterium]|nr:hypothetical protein [Chitinispirillaceae bacterium]
MYPAFCLHRGPINRCRFGIIVFVIAAMAQDITISKDSLKVTTHPDSSEDSVLITYTGSDTIWISSASIRFDVLDTSGLTLDTVSDGLEMLWGGSYGDSSFYYIWRVYPASGDNFPLGDKYIGGMDFNTPLVMHAPSSDSMYITYCTIGYSLSPNTPTAYPKKLSGTLSLTFNNGQTVDVRLYSDTTATEVRPNVFFPKRHSVNEKVIRRYLINGRRIPDNMNDHGLRRLQHILYEFQSRH